MGVGAQREGEDDKSPFLDVIVLERQLLEWNIALQNLQILARIETNKWTVHRKV